jgi:hypothetical protein|tara:strand:- start:172 stop:360 length:189 start_codon:yes stop_codon:yes gene_type:complete
MAESAFSLLRQNLQKMRKQHEENLGQGSAKDFAQYKKIIGIIEGLSIADREVADLEARLMEE